MTGAFPEIGEVEDVYLEIQERAKKRFDGEYTIDIRCWGDDTWFVEAFRTEGDVREVIRYRSGEGWRTIKRGTVITTVDKLKNK